MISDEVNREVVDKTVSISFRAASFTIGTFNRAIKSYLQEIERQNKPNAKKEPHGKMSLDKLVSLGAGANSIEMKKEDMKDFEKVAKKYQVDYAIRVDKSVDPPKYHIFFKGKDLDVISQVLREYTANQEKRKERVSLRERLKEKKRIVEEKQKNAEHKKERGKKRQKKREKVR